MKKLLLIPFFIFSCSPKNEVEEILTAKDSKWIYNDSRNFGSPSDYLSYMKFEADSCRNYDMVSGKVLDTAPADRGTWNYNPEDSILDIMGHTRKITAIAGDTIFMTNPEGKSESMLVRVR